MITTIFSTRYIIFRLIGIRLGELLLTAGIVRGEDDCRCFGPSAARSPKEVLVKDCALLLATITTRRLNDMTIYFWHTIKGYVAALAFAIGPALPYVGGLFTFAPPLNLN